jgi:hypothetical protein
MVKRTYGDIKATLGRVAGMNGMRVDDTRLLSRVNEVLEDIMESEDFPFVVDRYVISHPGENNLFVLPNNIDRILNITIDNDPIFIRSPW